MKMLIKVLTSYRWVTYWRVKPDIKYFFFVARFGHRDSPLQISSDASWLEALLQPGFSDLLSIL